MRGYDVSNEPLIAESCFIRTPSIRKSYLNGSESPDQKTSEEELWQDDKSLNEIIRQQVKWCMDSEYTCGYRYPSDRALPCFGPRAGTYENIQATWMCLIRSMWGVTLLSFSTKWHKVSGVFSCPKEGGTWQNTTKITILSPTRQPKRKEQWN